MPEYGGTPAQVESGEDSPYNVEAQGVTLELAGVVHFEWKHCVTVEFADRDTYDKAKRLTGWEAYDEDELILEAPTKSDEGYDHPAIIAQVPYELEEGYGEGTAPSTAYCGFYLTAQ